MSSKPDDNNNNTQPLIGSAKDETEDWESNRLSPFTIALAFGDTLHNATTTLPVPIALNQPPEPLRLGPSDDAEWAAFTAEALLKAGDGTSLGHLTGDRRTRAAIDLTWNALAAEVAAAARRAPEIESRLVKVERPKRENSSGLGEERLDTRFAS